jgi:hypothetical protein
MDRYGVSPLELMSILGPMFIIAPMLLWFLVIGPLVLYPLARWRAAREPYMDPQLGLKVALHYFKLLAFHTLLLGAVTLIFTIISKGEGGKSALYRAAFGFLVPGGLVFGAHNVLLKRTNEELFLGVRRLFLGYNLLVTGLIGFAALLLGFQALFAKGSSGDGGRMFLAAVLVYVSGWAGLGFLFGRAIGFDPSTGAGVPPQSYMPGPPPPGDVSGVAAPAQPGLPPLSAGAFPPIASPGSIEPK